MSKPCIRPALGLALQGAGWASRSRFLDGKPAVAMQTAVNRGQFEMNCRAATEQVRSREVVQPARQGPVVGGIQRAELTVGVSGCGRRTTLVVVCPGEGDGCFATGPGRFMRE